MYGANFRLYIHRQGFKNKMASNVLILMVLIDIACSGLTLLHINMGI